MGEPLTSVRRLNARDKAVQALVLRKEGHTYDAIAQQVGFRTRQAAYNAVIRLLRKTAQEPADELRKLELDRLTEIINVLWPKVIAVDMQAIDRYLRLSKRMSELTGIDAPIKTEDKSEVIIIEPPRKTNEQSNT